MHPWGKWGRSFVSYGVHAAREALKDSDVPWGDVDLVVGGEAELVVETLYADDTGDRLIWRWKPVTEMGEEADQ